jgi:hypothetical protein
MPFSLAFVIAGAMQTANAIQRQDNFFIFRILADPVTKVLSRITASKAGNQHPIKSSKGQPPSYVYRNCTKSSIGQGSLQIAGSSMKYKADPFFSSIVGELLSGARFHRQESEEN